MTKNSPETGKSLPIGWDSADWKVIHPLMDAGEMPHLQHLGKEGVMGNLAALHPDLSPMLWTAIVKGKRPFKHGIWGVTEPDPHGLSKKINLSPLFVDTQAPPRYYFSENSNFYHGDVTFCPLGVYMKYE